MAIPQHFIKSLSDAGGHSSPAHFEIQIDPSPEIEFLPLHLRCHQAVIPGLTAATSQYATGMPEKNNAYRATFEDVTLGFYCTETLVERRYFEWWQGLIFPLMGHRSLSPSTALQDSKWMSWPIGYRNDYTKKIIIKKLSWDGIVTKQYILHNAFPVTINETPLDWSQEEILKIEVVFSYDWFTMQDLEMAGLKLERNNSNLSDINKYEKQENDGIRNHQSLENQTRLQAWYNMKSTTDTIRKKFSAQAEATSETEKSNSAPKRRQLKDIHAESTGVESNPGLTQTLADAKRPGNLAAVAMKSVPSGPPVDTRKTQDIAAEIFNPFKKRTRSLRD